ncbi:MAG: hypothetical protein ACTS73_03355 [Arsenophonus sp. NEOnobi-MAG3]
MLRQDDERHISDGFVTMPLIRNGYFLQRTIQSDIGDIDIKVPKIMDCSTKGICLNG